MSKLISGTDRNQYVMTSLESLIDPDNEVRVIDAIIDSLDLKKFGFIFLLLLLVDQLILLMIS